VATLRHWMIVGAASLCMAHGPGGAGAADVGGWYADQQKAAAATVPADTPSCPLAVARAAAEPTAISTYQAAHCYLQGDAPDLVAAKAWLSRSADLDFLPAHRLLRSLQLAEAGVHARQRHCHDLGEGRQLCHGGAPPVAATN